MFQFIYPFALILLIFALVFLIGFVYWEFRRKKQFNEFGNLDLIKRLMPTRSLLRQRIKFALVLVTFISLIFIVARTQFASTKGGDAKTLNVELVAVVDVSNSMLAEDENPSRLEKAKIILNNFFEHSDNIKFGLVEFAGTAVTRMPLTSDRGSATMFVNSMSPTDISSQGTAIGAALRQAQKIFSKNEGVERCILLITDAENHEDDAASTADAVYTETKAFIDVIGIGSADGANLTVGDSVLNDENGNPVLSKFDEEIAKSIVDKGKGKYFHSESPSEISEAVKGQLQSNSTLVDGASSNRSFVDIFTIFAWISFACLLLDAILMERRNHLMDKIKQFKIKSK